MILKRSLFFVILFSLILNAQEGDLTLDPNDIPLNSDPIQVPSLDETVPESAPATAPDTLTAPPEVPQQAEPPQIAPSISQPTPAPQVEEYKSTPSNLEVKSESTAESQKKEERFSNDYTKYHKDSTSEQNWEKVVGKRTADTYVVNKGDTLWDISGTLFGDPFYWPKVWSLNRDLIYNPHVIFPDMKIKFYQGSTKVAPTLATDNSKAPVVPPSESTSEPSQAAKIEAPVEQKNKDDDVPEDTKIVVSDRRLPKSFQDKKISVQKKVEIQVEEQKEAPVEVNIVQEFYLSEGPMLTVGEVVEIKNEFSSAGDGQYVFIKFESEPNGTYTILKPGKRMRPVGEVKYDVEMYEVEGEVKVLGKVNTAENVYRAKVTKTNTLVSQNSLAIPGRMKTFKISDMTAETTASRGRIIGNLSEFGTVGQGSFVVINQGSQGGYQVNMKLPIYEELEVRNRASLKSLVKENPERIGALVIVDTTANYSVAYITKVVDPVSISDIVASPDGEEFSPDSAKADDTELETTPSEVAPADESEPIEEF